MIRTIPDCEFNVLNDESVAGVIDLVPAHGHLPRSHSLQYAHAQGL